VSKGVILEGEGGTWSQSRRAMGEEKLGVLSHLTAGRSSIPLERWSWVSMLRDTASHHFTGET